MTRKYVSQRLPIKLFLSICACLFGFFVVKLTTLSLQQQQNCDYLPDVAENEVGEHDSDDCQLIGEAGRNPEVHPGAEVLRVEQGQEDEGGDGCHGPYSHDA